MLKTKIWNRIYGIFFVSVQKQAAKHDARRIFYMSKFDAVGQRLLFSRTHRSRLSADKSELVGLGIRASAEWTNASFIAVKCAFGLVCVHDTALAEEYTVSSITLEVVEICWSLLRSIWHQQRWLSWKSVYHTSTLHLCDTEHRMLAVP